jgi:hypothetical protein
MLDGATTAEASDFNIQAIGLLSVAFLAVAGMTIWFRCFFGFCRVPVVFRS